MGDEEQKQSSVEVELQKISAMLSDVLTSYKEDRELAKGQYDFLKDRLAEVYDTGMPMSEDGILEDASNKALKNYIDISKRLDKILETVTKMFNTQNNNNTKLIIADKIIDGSAKIEGPADFRKLLG